MSRFTTRVELYGNPTYETYNSLHNAMLKGSFTRQVMLESKKCWFPNAEYTWEGASTAEAVKNAAVKIAATVWINFGVMVTQTEVSRAFHNLQKV